MRKLDVLLLMGVEAVLLCAGVAAASRNSSGTDSAVNGPYVAGTTISSSAINARFADIETEITSSLDRSGRGAMLAKLQLFDGTTTAPGLTFGTENTAGLYRAGSGDLRMTFNGTNAQKWQSTGVTLPLGVIGDVVPDNAGSNAGTISNALRFGSTTAGEGIGSKRTATGNQFGLDLYTNSTARLQISNTGLITLAGSGVSGDGSAFKHKRFGASCSTLAVAGNNCTSVLSWTTAFADANYTVTCIGQGPAGQPLLTLNTHVAASTTINVTAITAVIASFTEVDCIAVHD